MRKLEQYSIWLIGAILLSAFMFDYQIEKAKRIENRKKQQVTQVIKKVVKSKNQAQETTYKYKYNFWKGNFYHQPDIHTIYYLNYTDGSYDVVDIGKFGVTNIGDTITKVVII